MRINDQYSVSSTTASSKGQSSAIRVYYKGELIAQVELSRRSPLKYLQSLTRGRYRDSMEAQLRDNKVPKHVIDFVMNGKELE